MGVKRIKLTEIEHIEFYVPTKRMSITNAYNSHLWNGRKCDAICNGTLFDMGTSANSTITYGATEGNQVGYLFANYGMMFKDNKVEFGTLQQAKDSKGDLVGSAPLIVRDGKTVAEWGNRGASSSVTGNHIRTAIGLSDTEFVMYVSNDEISLSTLASRMKGYGCKYANNLDGGGSTCLFDNGKSIRNTSRLLANFIMVWTKKEVKGEDEVITVEKINVNGVDMEFNTIVKDGVTYMEMRKLAETIGCEVGYDAATKKKSITTKKDNAIPVPEIIKNGIKVWLDAGHSSNISCGASGNGIKEEEYALEVVLKLGSILTSKGFEVYYSRVDGNAMNGAKTGSQDLTLRCKAANEKDVDYFISVHNNAADSTQANGIETLVYSEKATNSVALAKVVQDNLIKATGMTDRGLKYRSDLCVLRETNMDAILVELGFLSNVGDSTKLKSSGYTDLLAESIASSIGQFCAK